MPAIPSGRCVHATIGGQQQQRRWVAGGQRRRHHTTPPPTSAAAGDALGVWWMGENGGMSAAAAAAGQRQLRRQQLCHARGSSPWAERPQWGGQAGGAPQAGGLGGIGGARRATRSRARATGASRGNAPRASAKVVDYPLFWRQLYAWHALCVGRPAKGGATRSMLGARYSKWI